jgi:hypothetical protein
VLFPGNFSGGFAVICVGLQPLNLLRTSKRFKSKSGCLIGAVGYAGLGSVWGRKALMQYDATDYLTVSYAIRMNLKPIGAVSPREPYKARSRRREEIML